MYLCFLFLYFSYIPRSLIWVHEDHEVHEVIRQILDKLPDEHAIRAIRLDDEIERGVAGAQSDRDPEPPAAPPSLGDRGGDGPPDTVA